VREPFAIETERLLIRPWEPRDDAGFREMVLDPEMMRYISGGVPWDEQRIAEFHARQRRHLVSHGCCMGALVERESGSLAGVCGLQPMRAGGEIEVGWWVAKRLWGRGLATEGGAAALRFGWQRLGLRRVKAIAEPQNRASRRVMEKLGLRFEREAAGRDFGLAARDVALVVYTIERPVPEDRSDDSRIGRR
jgi:RimJ/RimL family protein N-acetyltransferase